MKSKSILYTTLILSILFINSCEKEEIERDKPQTTVEGTGVTINKEQRIIDLETSNVTDVITTDTIVYNDQKLPEYQIAVEGNSEDISKIETGTIINVPQGDKGGILMFVTEVEIGDVKHTGLKSTTGVIAIIVKGFQVTLDMYFNYENATLEFSTPANRSKRNLDIPNKLMGKELVFGDKRVSFIAKSKDFDINFSSSPDTLCKLKISSKIWESEDSYLSVDGTIGIHPAIDLFMHYEPIEGGSKLLELFEAAAVPDAILWAYKDKNYLLGNMKQFKANVYADINKDMTVKFHLAKEFEKKDPFQIPIGNFSIPTVPVSAQVEFAFEVDLKAVGAMDLELYEKEEFDLAVGVDLDRELPNPIWYFVKDSRSESGLILKAKIELTAGLSLVMETEVYVLGVVGPEIKVGPFVEGKATVEGVVGTSDLSSANWKLSADAGFRCGAKLNLAAFHIDKATWTMWDTVFVNYHQNIYTAPDHLKIENGNDQTGIGGQALTSPIEIGVYDSRDKMVSYLPVPIYFDPQTGSTEPSGVVLSQDGKSSVTWTLGSNNEDQRLNVYFKDGEDKKGEVQVNATAEEGQVPETGTFTDERDGNVYKWVKIGDQIWMAENLAYIPSVSAASEGSKSEAFYYVNGYEGTNLADSKQTNNYNKYGVLYNYKAAVLSCPSGWHIPSDSEWKELELHIGMTQEEVNAQYTRGNLNYKLKTISGWNNDRNGTDEVSFSALPAGGRHYNGFFSTAGASTSWWVYNSSTPGNYEMLRSLMENSTGIYRGIVDSSSGWSIRCVKN